MSETTSLTLCDYCERPYTVAVERAGKRLRYCAEHWAAAHREGGQ